VTATPVSGESSRTLAAPLGESAANHPETGYPEQLVEVVVLSDHRKISGRRSTGPPL
jgi:hypothetical protein